MLQTFKYIKSKSKNLKRWEQYCKLPWPDSLCFYLRGLVNIYIFLYDICIYDKALTPRMGKYPNALYAKYDGGIGNTVVNICMFNV